MESRVARFPGLIPQRLRLDLECIAGQLSDYYKPADVRLCLFSRQKLPGGAIPAELIQQRRADEVIRVIDELRERMFL
jgi:hypothetical protein